MTAAPKERVPCPANCGARVQVRRDGTTHRHARGGGYLGLGDAACEGSGVVATPKEGA